MKKVRDFVIILLAVLLITIIYLRAYSAPDRDDSDPPGGSSHLIVRTDALTGCQYLIAGTFGSTLTPRLDGAGHHVGCR